MRLHIIILMIMPCNSKSPCVGEGDYGLLERFGVTFVGRICEQIEQQNFHTWTNTKSHSWTILHLGSYGGGGGGSVGGCIFYVVVRWLYIYVVVVAVHGGFAAVTQPRSHLEERCPQ